MKYLHTGSRGSRRGGAVDARVLFLLGTALAILAGCASQSSSSYERLRALEEKPDYLAMAAIHLEKAEKARQSSTLLDFDRELSYAGKAYEEAKAWEKAIEVYSRRVSVWDGFRKGNSVRMLHLNGESYDPLEKVAESHADLAAVCSKTGDIACVEKHGEIAMQIYSPRASAHARTSRTGYWNSKHYGQSMAELIEAYDKVGRPEKALQASVLRLSVGDGLNDIWYKDAIDLAKKLRKKALAAELEKRQMILWTVVPRHRCDNLPTIVNEPYDKKMRSSALCYQAWADRLAAADAPGLAALARLEASELLVRVAEHEEEEKEAISRNDKNLAEAEEKNRKFTESMKAMESMIRAVNNNNATRKR